MSDAVAHNPPVLRDLTERRLRLWPGVLIVLLDWILLKVPGWVAPGTMIQFMASFMGSMVMAVLFFIWWMFLSRARWADRVFGLIACAAVGAAAYPLMHKSLQGSRFDEFLMSIAFTILPIVMTGWIIWLLITRSARPSVRMAGLVVVFLLTWGYFTTVRFEGTTGAFSAEFSFRWKPTAEEQFLAERSSKPVAPKTDVSPAEKVELRTGDWPGFRGPARDGRLPGVRIATDWKQNQPKELWRHRVGPGWSSWAVIGSRAFTQEQRGPDEVVVCYDANSGSERWAYQDQTRFEEVMGGPGPRATPTFHDGRIYTLGATGHLACLDAVSGKKIWVRDISADSGAKAPMWGFAASPLVVQGVVTVFAGGANGKGVLGYRADSGDLAWSAGEITNSYCSMQPAKIDGLEQVVVATREGLTSLDPVAGKVLWQFEWSMDEQFNRVTQPAIVGEADVLIGTGFGFGLRRVHVGHDKDSWKTEQVWESRAISPYYNDLVIHKDHLYGFNANLLTCVRLSDGKAKWKERGYDNGQVLLLPDQDLLVIQAEKGDVALVEANPDRRKELGRISALKGKTWNHPVIAHGKLFVRNGEEAACFQLTPDSGGGTAGK